MKKNKMNYVILGLVLLVVFLGGCQSQGPTVQGPSIEDEYNDDFSATVVDGLGSEVTIDRLPERIISIAPSQTEIIYALGIQHKLVAVSDSCDYPAEALTKEKVGSSWGINIERVIELEPDLVFVYGEGDLEAVAQMEAAGITVVKYMPESIEEIFSLIEDTGKLTNTSEMAQELIDTMTARRDNILEKVKGQPVKRVFYQVWDEPLMTAGTGSFIDELIQLAGGENIAADGSGAYPQFSTETLVERDPEIFLAPAHMEEAMNLSEEEKTQLINQIKSRPGYGEITAIQNNEIHLLEPNIVSRPGTRIIDALELIARAIHPEAFE
ncbi:ABC transporter substrate-binding protein [Alkaliphilus crotonatoxidans]